jgi:hypothetical protein
VSGNHAEEDRGRSALLVDLPYGVHSNRAEDAMSLDDVDLHFTFARYCLSAKEAAKGVTAGRLAMSGTQFLKVRMMGGGFRARELRGTEGWGGARQGVCVCVAHDMA